MDLSKFWPSLANLDDIWAKAIKIWTNLIRFGQNQNLASPKTFEPPTVVPGTQRAPKNLSVYSQDAP